MNEELAYGTGYELVDSEVFCVLTRFRVRSVWSIAKFYLSYRRIQRDLARHDIKGLLKSLFLVENPHTCYTLSFWSSEQAVLDFNAHVVAHIHSANAAIPALSFDKNGRRELWSAQFRLDAVSRHNMRWEGLAFAGAYRARAPHTMVAAARANSA